MADSILVIVEQREGKLNRVSWETLTAGQALAAETGWTLEAAVVGSELAVHIVGAERKALVIPPSPYDPAGKAMRG